MSGKMAAVGGYILDAAHPPLQPLGERAWAKLHDANASLRWRVGGPYVHEEMASNPWDEYAYDPTERPMDGRRSREWTAIGTSEMMVVSEMARCLRDIAAGRVPR